MSLREFETKTKKSIFEATKTLCKWSYLDIFKTSKITSEKEITIYLKKDRYYYLIESYDTNEFNAYLNSDFRLLVFNILTNLKNRRLTKGMKITQGNILIKDDYHFISFDLDPAQENKIINKNITVYYYNKNENVYTIQYYISFYFDIENEILKITF